MVIIFTNIIRAQKKDLPLVRKSCFKNNICVCEGVVKLCLLCLLQKSITISKRNFIRIYFISRLRPD